MQRYPARPANAGPVHFCLLLGHASHQQTQQPFICCRIGVRPGLQPVKCGIQAVSVRFLLRFRHKGHNIVVRLTDSTSRLFPPAGHLVQHTLIYPVQRDLIGKRRPVIKGQGFKSGKAAQQPFQVCSDDAGQHLLARPRQGLKSVPLQVKPGLPAFRACLRLLSQQIFIRLTADPAECPSFSSVDITVFRFGHQRLSRSRAVDAEYLIRQREAAQRQ